MVADTRKIASDWKFDVVAIGYPGLVVQNRPTTEPNNLGKGWTNFDFEDAFGCPVKMMNDAAMQALGSYKGGIMLFLGLGTGLGSALVADHVVIPMEIGHLACKNGTFEDYVGYRGMKKLGKKKWTKYVTYLTERLMATVHPDDVVLGGGNAKKLKKLPPGCRAGHNANAFIGGFRMWEGVNSGLSYTRPLLVPDQPRSRKVG